MTPFERLIAQRPDPAALHDYIRELGRPLEIIWGSAMGEQVLGGVTWDLGPELSREPDLVKYAATYDSVHEGRFQVVLEIRLGELQPGDDPQGACELGPILNSLEWYEFGADLVTLHSSGFRLSWTAAQWLYAVARDELVDRHHDSGKAHGALTPRHTRLALFETPYGDYPRHGDSDHEDVPPPLKFLYGSREPASDTARAVELSVLASTIAGITLHPDPQIDRLLRDPSSGSHEVLRDLLLQRGEPVEQLLRDRTNAPGLALVPLADDPHVDDELSAMWDRVLVLDPMIDDNKQGIFDLPGPA